MSEDAAELPGARRGLGSRMTQLERAARKHPLLAADDHIIELR